MKNLNELAHKIHESNKLRGFDVAQDNMHLARPIKIAEKIAFHHDINLEKHIALKMRYNETRPYKHGKRY